MISHPLSRSSIVDQGPVCRARGRTRRTSARHFPRVGHRPPVHGFMPCRLHAAALFCASKASTVAPAIRARDFVKRPLARQIKRHQGKIAPSIILRGGTLLQRRGQARRSAQNVHRLGSSWAHTASIHRLRVLSGRRSSSTGAHHFDPGIVGKRRSGAEESIAIVPEFATGAGDRRHPAPARRPVPSNRVAQRADNESYCARVLKVRIHLSPPASQQQTVPALGFDGATDCPKEPFAGAGPIGKHRRLEPVIGFPSLAGRSGRPRRHSSQVTGDR